MQYITWFAMADSHNLVDMSHTSHNQAIAVVDKTMVRCRQYASMSIVLCKPYALRATAMVLFVYKCVG